MSQEQIEKDFLIEIARAMEILDTCGLRKKEAHVELMLPADEFDRVYFAISKKSVTYGDKPEKQFKVMFSGMEVKFVKSCKLNSSYIIMEGFMEI